MSVCQSCRAPLVWAETPTGRKIPLDPEEIEILVVDLPKGHAAKRLTLIDESGTAIVGVLSNSPDAAALEGLLPGSYVRRTGRVCHFATCPDAPKFRKPKR